MAVTTNTRKLAALLGASGAGIHTDGTLQTAAIKDGAVTAVKVAADMATQAELDASLYNDVGVRQDIITLALKEGVAENSTKFNLTNSSIVQFQADADFNLAGSTTTTRNALSEYISTTAIYTYPSGQSTNFAPSLKQVTSTSGAPATSTWAGVNATDDVMQNAGSTYASGAMDFAWDLSTDFTARAWFVTSGGVAEDETYASGTILITTDTSISAGDDPDIWDTPSSNSYYAPSPSEWADYLTSTYNTTIGTTGLTNNIAYGTADRTVDISSESAVVAHYWNSGSDYGGIRVVNDASANTMTLDAYAPNSFSSISTDGNVTITNVPAAGRAYITMGDANNQTGIYWSTTYLNGALTDYSTVDNAAVSLEAAGTALGTTNVPSSAVTEVSGVMLLKHAYGTNTLGTDVKVYFTANNSAWTEASSYTDAGTFSTGVKMIKLGKTTCTSGSDVRWKIVWANQSAESKEGHIYGIGLNY